MHAAEILSNKANLRRVMYNICATVSGVKLSGFLILVNFAFYFCERRTCSSIAPEPNLKATHGTGIDSNPGKPHI